MGNRSKYKRPTKRGPGVFVDPSNPSKGLTRGPCGTRRYSRAKSTMGSKTIAIAGNTPSDYLVWLFASHDKRRTIVARGRFHVRART